jgi:hypothetical protein
VTVVDISDHLLRSQLDLSLVRSAHRCGLCKRTWLEHDIYQRFACCVELERLRQEARPCNVPPVPWRVTEGVRLVRTVLESTGRYSEAEVGKTAAAIVTALVNGGVVPGGVR